MIHWIKRIIEYAIRHLKLNRVFIKWIDKLVKDQINMNYSGAGDLLRAVCEPVSSTKKDTEKIINRQYNLQIVIPMFNVKKYVKECIDSILNQSTHYTYIIYAVDDGSSDGTDHLIKTLYHNDERIHYIRKENEGAAAARNAGLESLVADYVMFVDADDRLKEDAINNLLDVAYKESADVVEGGYELFRKKTVSKRVHTDAVISEACGKLWGFSWAKVFRSELFTDIRFPDKYWYEDTYVSYLIYTRCQSAVTISQIVYCYRNNMKGMSHIRVNKKNMDAFWIIKYILDEMKRRNIQFTQNIYEQMIISISTSTKRVLYMKKNLRRCLLAAYSEIMHDNFEESRTENDSLKVFEKVIRNNDFRKYRYLAICLEDL